MMQGNIDFTGSLSGSIAGGGGGGSEVTITPTLQSGTKIADYTIDSESGSLYAPTPPQGGVLDVQVSNTQEPDYESIVENSIAKLNLYPYLEKSEAYTIIDLVNDEIERIDGKVGNLEQIVPYKQDKLTAGNNITIDQNNVISATSSGGVNYSTTEQDTGIKWIDNKPVYQRVFHTDTVTASPFTIGNIANLGTIIEINGYFLRSGTWKAMDGRSETSAYNNFYCLPYADVTTGNVIVLFGSYTANQFDEMNIIVRYTKSV